MTQFQARITLKDNKLQVSIDTFSREDTTEDERRICTMLQELVLGVFEENPMLKTTIERVKP